MKIAFYCQHVLGVGHLHRSLEICKTLARRHTVTMIAGGAPLQLSNLNFSIFQLPGLMMDENFTNLAPYDSIRTLEDVKNQRQKMLYNFFVENKPDIFITELYPFGRKAFRFELDPVLEAIQKKTLAPCNCYCSVRDILVERSDKDKFESRIISTLNRYFDGVLIHGDKDFIGLDATFSRLNDITIPVAYTGYITPAPKGATRHEIRYKNSIDPQAKLIVASIGGGNVGIELLVNCLEAFKKLNDDAYWLQIFTGPYISDSDFAALQKHAERNTHIARFTQHFTDWLQAADLSISMAGYNTTMNILAAGIPALMYPFRHNQEQMMRLNTLEQMVPIQVLDSSAIEPVHLANLVISQLRKTRYSSPVSLDGAENTLKIVEEWYSNIANINEE